METVTMYSIYKKCPKCGKMDAQMWNENRKMKDDRDWTKPIEEHTFTYIVITHYKCKSCNHFWKK